MDIFCPCVKKSTIDRQVAPIVFLYEKQVSFVYCTLMETFFNRFVFCLLLHLFAMEKVAPVATDTTPIDIKVREEAASGALSIMANGEWIDPLTAHNQGRLKSYIRINEKYLNNMPIKDKLADKSKPILSIGKNFNLEPSGIEKIDVPLGTEQSNIIACFVKGDKTNDQAGAG